MTDTTATPPPSPAQKQAQDIAQRLLNFDTLIGPTLVKIVYFIGLAGIAIGVLLAIFSAFGMMRYEAVGGLGMIVAALIAAVVGVLGWRFVCELWLLAFLIYNRMAEIRDRLPPR